MVRLQSQTLGHYSCLPFWKSQQVSRSARVARQCGACYTFRMKPVQWDAMTERETLSAKLDEARNTSFDEREQKDFIRSLRARARRIAEEAGWGC